MSSLSPSNSLDFCPGVNKCFIRPRYAQRGFDAGDVLIVYESYDVYSVSLEDNKCTTITSNSNLPTKFTISTFYSDETAGERLADATFRSFVSKSSCGDYEDTVTSSTLSTILAASTSSLLGTLIPVNAPTSVGPAVSTSSPVSKNTKIAILIATRVATAAASTPVSTIFSTNVVTSTLEAGSPPRPTSTQISLPTPASTNLKSEVKIIIGVLIPAISILLLAIGILFWRKWRQRTDIKATKEPTTFLGGIAEYFFQRKTELSGEQARHEMHGEDIRQEMADNTRYELEANASPHEMQAEERRQELKAEYPCYQLKSE